MEPERLVINYSLLRQLAGDMRTLRSSLDTDLRMASGGRVTGDRGPADVYQVGNHNLYTALALFFAAGVGPFNEALDSLDQLAGLFDGVSDAFFNTDADLAGGVLDNLAGLTGAKWAADQQEYQQYLSGNWPEDKPPPPNPGDLPGEPGLPDELQGLADTQTTYDDQGRVLTQTATITTPDGQTYTRTITYTYHDVVGQDGKIQTIVDFESTVTYQGGDTGTLSRQTHPDGSYTVTRNFGGEVETSTITPGANGGYTQRDVAPDGTVTTTTYVTNPGKGADTKTVVDPKGTFVYSGDMETDDWRLEEYYTPDGIGGPLLYW